MRIQSFFFSVRVLCLLCLAGTGLAQRLTLLYHSDFHSFNSPYRTVLDKDTVWIQGAAGLHGLAQAVRDTCAPSLWLFAGDEFTGTALHAVTRGASQIQIASRLGTDVAVLGNHEFDLGIERAEAWRDSVGFPVLGGANLRYADDGRPFARTHFDTTINGVAIRVIGLGRSYGGLKLKQIDPVEAVRPWIPADNRLLVVLSHRGYAQDSMLAMEIPEIDIIVSGHHHWTLEKPMWIGGAKPRCGVWRREQSTVAHPKTLYLAAHANGVYLGVLSLLVKDGDIEAASTQLLRNDGTRAPVDTALAAYVRSLEDLYTKGFEEPVARLTAPLTTEGKNEGTLGRWISDCCRAATGADIGWIDWGRRSLLFDPVTTYDLYMAAPYRNRLIVVELSGCELERAMRHAARHPREIEAASGMTVTLDTKRGKATDLRIGGKPVERARTYRMVLCEYHLEQNEKYLGLSWKKRKRIATNLSDSDAVIKIAREAGVISPPEDVRVTVLR